MAALHTEISEIPEVYRYWQSQGVSPSPMSFSFSNPARDETGNIEQGELGNVRSEVVAEACHDEKG